MSSSGMRFDACPRSPLLPGSEFDVQKALQDEQALCDGEEAQSLPVAIATIEPDEEDLEALFAEVVSSQHTNLTLPDLPFHSGDSSGAKAWAALSPRSQRTIGGIVTAFDDVVEAYIDGSEWLCRPRGLGGVAVKGTATCHGGWHIDGSPASPREHYLEQDQVRILCSFCPPDQAGEPSTTDFWTGFLNASLRDSLRYGQARPRLHDEGIRRKKFAVGTVTAYHANTGVHRIPDSERRLFMTASGLIVPLREQLQINQRQY